MLTPRHQVSKTLHRTNVSTHPLLLLYFMDYTAMQVDILDIYNTLTSSSSSSSFRFGSSQLCLF